MRYFLQWRFSIASDRSTLDKPKLPPDFQEASLNVLPVNVEQETVEAAVGLLGLGHTRPVKLLFPLQPAC
ncbi:hypothetical protein PtB15_15B252 [Puccinia triticina]|nr:hypothetical protein PtB15_15B252 [Puccinia triticina]